MPVDTKPEDKPAPVCFHLEPKKHGAIEITIAPGPLGESPPYRIQGGRPHFADRDALKARVVAVGMTPAVAEDSDRTFNATARQLRELGFSVEVEQKAA